MSEKELNNVNVISQDVLPTPKQIREELPVSAAAEKTIIEGRNTIQQILDRRDNRIFVVTGPCSIHDEEAALDYANRLKALADKVSDRIVIVMRVYFEKPRTALGWKGYINDPYMDDSFAVDEGLRRGRRLLLKINEIGLPTGTEALDPISPQFYHDLIAWTAIGARTTESQTHREMASGLSTPVGFKNATDGNLKVAVNAMHSASSPHSFLGINQDGQCTIVRTKGNRYSHVVLRGGAKPNYDSVSVALCEEELTKAGLPDNIVIDCSHGNSSKKPELQPLVARDVVNQIDEGNKSIMGIMLESHLKAGNQKLTADPSKLEYGISITDACIDWETTETLILDMYEKLGTALSNR